MRVICHKLNNNGVVLDKQLVYKANEEAIKAYAQGVHELYSWGMLKSDSVFDYGDFYDNLYKKFSIKDLDFWMSNTGKRIVTPLTIEYGIQRNKDNESLAEYLTYFKKVVQALEDVKTLKELYRYAKFKKTQDLVEIKPKLQVTNKLRSISSIPLDYSVSRRCFKSCENLDIIEVPYNLGTLNEILKHIGVSERVYNVDDGEPLFLSGCTRELELKLLPLICEGNIKCDGKYGELLIKAIYKYYRDFGQTSKSMVNCISFYEYIFEKALESNSDYLKNYDIERDNIVYITDTCISLGVERQNINIKYIDKVLPLRDYVTGADLHILNRINGFGGVFMSETDALRSKYDIRCLPVRLLNNKGKVELYYPAQFLYTSELDAISIKPLDNYTYSSIEDYLKLCKCSTEAELKLKAINSIDDINISKILWALFAGVIESDSLDYLSVSYETEADIATYTTAYNMFASWVYSLFG